MSTQLIPVVASVIGNQTVQTVDGRALHSFLEVKTRFNDWIVTRIKEYGFEEGKDFRSFLSETSQEGFTENSVKPQAQGGRPSKEYALTLDMAKELSMVERTAKGKQARQYFIECERQALDSRCSGNDRVGGSGNDKVLPDAELFGKMVAGLQVLRAWFKVIEPVIIKAEALERQMDSESSSKPPNPSISASPSTCSRAAASDRSRSRSRSPIRYEDSFAERVRVAIAGRKSVTVSEVLVAMGEYPADPDLRMRVEKALRKFGLRTHWGVKP